jgi:hypothetical protein
MDPAVSPRRLAGVAETVRAYPRVFPSEASLRWQIFSNPEFNRACVRRLGKRVLVDLDAFEAWLDAQASAK